MPTELCVLYPTQLSRKDSYNETLLLVALHWILAIMILMALVFGGPTMANMTSTDPQNMFGLTGHMIWGMTIGVLLIIRLIVRLRSQNPQKADAGNALFNFGARTAHWGLYILSFTMVACGLGTALSAGLFGIPFGGNGEPIPAELSQYASRVAHGIIAKLMLALILPHIVGWAYHQFALKDKLLSRMLFGKRRTDETQ